MLTARRIFLSHLDAYKDAVDHESIVAREPAEHRENARARMMRNGLAVIAFNILEDFLRRRAKEILSHIGRAGIQFGRLPEPLRQILTAKALAAVAFQLRSRRLAHDEIVFTQDMAQQIASTSAAPFDACDMSFGYDGSNLTEGAVEDLLRALSVDKPWESIGSVAARAGIGTLKLGARAAFESIARKRHEAAHDPQADVQPIDLKATHLNVLGIALGFDAIASMAAFEFGILNQEVIGGRKRIKQGDVRLYFIDHRRDQRYGTKREDAKKYRRCFGELEQARGLAREVCLRSREICVVRSVQGIPMDWELVALQGF
jgi:hypothetical protein